MHRSYIYRITVGLHRPEVDIHTKAMHIVHVLMRDEKEERKKSKVKQTTRQSNTAHPGSHFSCTVMYIYIPERRLVGVECIYIPERRLVGVECIYIPERRLVGVECIYIPERRLVGVECIYIPERRLVGVECIYIPERRLVGVECIYIPERRLVGVEGYAVIQGSYTETH